MHKVVTMVVTVPVGDDVTTMVMKVYHPTLRHK